MKKIFFSSLMILSVTFSGVLAQSTAFTVNSDFLFQSEFEKEAFNKYIEGEDEFNLYLAFDEQMNKDEAANIYEVYSSLIKEMDEDNIRSKKMNKRIKLTNELLEYRFIKSYAETDYFGNLMLDGHYNFLTKSMLYSLVFDHVEIPFKVMGSEKDVYIVANPGPSSVVIESNNPLSEKSSYSSDEKKEKIKTLKDGSEYNEEELEGKSFEEIFAAKYDDVKELDSKALLGIQYYVKAKAFYENNDYINAYEELKKAHVFFPNQQVDYLMSSSLQILIERSSFKDPDDMGLLSQFSRINGADKQIVLEIFQKTINDQLKKGAKHEHCDALFGNLVSGIEDTGLVEEISFKYNFLMSLHFKDSREAEDYLKGAMILRSTHPELLDMMNVHFHNYFLEIYEQPKELFSEVSRVRREMDFSCLQDELDYFEMLAVLQLAESSVTNKNVTEAESYLDKFETLYRSNLFDEHMQDLLTNSYRSLAVKLYYDGKKSKAKEIVDRGLVFVPDNSFLKSVVY